MTKTTQLLPLLPLRDVVIFPDMVIPLFVRREESIRALEAAMAADKQIFLVTQKDQSVEEPKEKDLFIVGTISNILQLLRLPDGSVKVLVEGASRAGITEFTESGEYYTAAVEPLEAKELVSTRGLQALMRALLVQFEELTKMDKKMRGELLASFTKIEDADRLADAIASHLSVKVEKKQQVLEALEVPARLSLVSELLAQELEMIKVEEEVQKLVESRVKNTQRHYYLSEKMRAIQDELDGLDKSGGGAAGTSGSFGEQEELKQKIDKAGMPKEAKEKAMAEFAKLKMMPPMSAEATVCRNYLDTLLQVPWRKKTKVNTDLAHAEAILDRDHFGLKEVKERILEYLAVQLRVKKIKGPILCLVGPPGVGKTSLGKSIAEATGRKFARVALGGVRDEAEIRGHRRTYIGSMPGKIIQRLMKVKARNPLFMLDEVDKMMMDSRGDPVSALLEVLDSEQNNAFGDHYLEVDYDLSDVIFVATANSLDIPLALLDRMEIIRIPGYTESEKLMIAKNYLIPRQMEQNGLKKNELKIADPALLEIIRTYTKEAGVRSLEREIAKVCRKVVRELEEPKKVQKKTSLKQKLAKVIQITMKNLEQYLGVKRYRFGLAEEKDQVGQVTGLAWTEVGGELLTIETQTMPGKGKSLYTGRLGDVMQESIHAATSVVRSRAASLGISEKFFQENDVHIHVPEGATPKDGPSAGIGMCTALISAITQTPVRADVAMTGEITLRGEVLPIGGLKEKLLAALRGGIKEVLIPEDNRRDLKELPDEVKKVLTITPVKWIDEVLDIALTSTPIPLEAGDKGSMAAVIGHPKKESTIDSGPSAEAH